MNSTITLIAAVSVIANLVLLAKLAGARRDLAIVVRSLKRISGRHNQVLAQVKEMEVVLALQGRTLQAQRMLLVRLQMHGHDRCIWVNGKRR